MNPIPNTSAADRIDAQVWDVAALLMAASDTLQARFGALSVKGELAGFSRASSGHCYFSLKDSQGQTTASLRCAMFRRAASLLDFLPKDGQQVELRGRIAVYEARGELQCIVEAMRPVGAGSLMEQFVRLRDRLKAEGLFEPLRRKPIPGHPRAIGVVSSLDAAALADVLTALQRRAPHVRVVVYPSLVQGQDAPRQLMQALAVAQQRAEVDLLILCRGGGSMEDLWSFNDEQLVRAVAACALPVICGVGHETDITLCDLVADLRAPTPTAAAEMAAPAQADLLLSLDSLDRRLLRARQQRTDSAAQRLDMLAARLIHGTRSLQPHRQRLILLGQRAQAAMLQKLVLQQQVLEHGAQRWRRAGDVACAQYRSRWAGLGDRLGLLDPQRVLARGYALIEKASGTMLVSPSQLQAGETLKVSLAHGQAEIVVQRSRRLES